MASIKTEVKKTVQLAADEQNYSLITAHNLRITETKPTRICVLEILRNNSRSLESFRTQCCQIVAAWWLQKDEKFEEK